MKMSISDQISGFVAKRAETEARRTAVQAKASDEGRAKDENEREEFETLTKELSAIDAELKDLRVLEDEQKAAAKPAIGATPNDAAVSRASGNQVITIKQNLPPGYGFARMVLCKAAAFLSQGSVSAADVAKTWFRDDPRIHLAVKAAVGAGTTLDSDYAAQLAYKTDLENEFIEFLRPMTIIGKFGTNGIPSLRRVPFNVRMVGQTTGGSAYWVGQGKPKPLTSFDFAESTLGIAKVATIAVIADELARVSKPGGEGLVRDALAQAVVAKIDSDLINPSVAAVSNVSPASLTNGLTAQTSAGTSADNARSDIGKLLKTFLDDNLDPSDAVIIMPSSLAMALGLMRNALGNKEFPDLTMRGGFLEGLPVITSQYAALTGGPGNIVVVVKASDVFLADDGQVTVDVSREASLEMLDSALQQDGSAGTGASLVSLWQNNLLGLRAERYINWKKRRAEAVVYMDDVNWGSIGSPA